MAAQTPPSKIESAVISKYEKVTGRVPVGLLDEMRVLAFHCQEEMLELLVHMDVDHICKECKTTPMDHPSLEK